MAITLLRTAAQLAIILILAGPAVAAAPPTPKRPNAPPPVVALSVLPPEVVIDRPGATQQLLVMGRRRDGSMVDLTSQARFNSSGPSAAVTPAGTVSAVRNGAARVTASLGSGSLRASVPVTLKNVGGAYRWDYARQIAPILVKAGCSATSCHGAAAGRGGLKLS
ncbi:MAG: Ig-like domain-containing protein, partial [Actinomycetota bacterium]